MRATTSGSAGAEGDTSPLMPHTTRKRYAVVSCHVERPLEDEIWELFSALQERRPGGFSVAALMRPADPAAGEDEDGWLERAREAAARGPLGHHTHWTAPDHARPTGDGTAERVLAEGLRLRELGLDPTLFCGGGWYTDADVAEACAELGYIDCTPRASRPAYLGSGEAWASLREPGPATASLGARARRDSDDALARRPRTRASPVAALPAVTHVYFHDTDLAERRRRRLLLDAVLRLLGADSASRRISTRSRRLDDAPEIAWDDVARL